MNRLKLFPFTILLISVGLLPGVQADDWPQWLGPQRDAVWRETGILSKFPEGGPKLRWKAKISSGYSGPAVAAGRVFIMDRLAGDVDPAKAKLLHNGAPPRNINFLRKLLPGQERVICLNEADGKVLWTQQVELSLYDGSRLCDWSTGHPDRRRGPRLCTRRRGKPGLPLGPGRVRDLGPRFQERLPAKNC